MFLQNIIRKLFFIISRIWIKSFKNHIRRLHKKRLKYWHSKTNCSRCIFYSKYYNTSFIFILECHKTALRWAPMRGCSAHCPDPQRWWLYVDFVSHNSSETTMWWQHPYVFFAYHSNREIHVTWSPHGAPSTTSCCGEIEVISLII